MFTLALHAALHVAVGVLFRRLPRAFCAASKRVPPFFAGVALLGMALGAWLVTACWPGDPWMAALGAFLLVGYSSALGVLAWKLLHGTWAAICDRVAGEI